RFSLFYFISAEGDFGNTITPLSGVENVKQRDNVSLQCSYRGAVQNLQWYRQYPGQALEYLLMSFETGAISKANEKDHRVSAELDKDKKHVFLKLIDTEVTDSAVYYCSLSPTVTETRPALYKN
ncbi:HV02 protein, partial [Polyodon spathula]|nr:HV02 protein [Polyodon spathula]